MSNFNDSLPSKADSLSSSVTSTTQKVQDAIAAAEEKLARLGRQGGDVYRTSNDAVAAYVDPLPGMVLAAAAGFLVGCLWASSRDY